MADVFGIALRQLTNADTPAPIAGGGKSVMARVLVGSKLILDNSGSNGIFSRSAAKVVGTQPIYLNVDLTLEIEGAIRGMGAAAKRGCAEAANAAAERVQRKLAGLAQLQMNCSPAEATSTIGISQHASESSPVAVVRVGQKTIPLNRFQPWETASGVSAMTIRSKGVRNYPDAFIAAGNDGEDKVFIRETSQRYPIREVNGPSVADFIRSEMPKQEPAIQLILFQELRNAANRIINEKFGYATIGGFEEFITDIA